MKEIVYSGEGDCDNWMDFKDLLIKQLQECDNEYQFHKIIIAIWMSVGINPEHTQELRKKIGLKPMSDKEMKRLKKMYEEDEKNDKNKIK